MFILKANLDSMLRKMDLKNIKIRVIGEKENIPADIQTKIDRLVEKISEKTKKCNKDFKYPIKFTR